MLWPDGGTSYLYISIICSNHQLGWQQLSRPAGGCTTRCAQNLHIEKALELLESALAGHREGLGAAEGRPINQVFKLALAATQQMETRDWENALPHTNQECFVHRRFWIGRGQRKTSSIRRVVIYTGVHHSNYIHHSFSHLFYVRRNSRRDEGVGVR